MSDKQKILDYLKSHGELSALDAWKEFNILTSLRSRISDLRKDGYNISTTIATSGDKHFAIYKLIQEPKQEVLF